MSGQQHFIGDRPSSRVTRPPGGASSISFGEPDDAVPVATPRKVKDYMKSSIAVGGTQNSALSKGECELKEVKETEEEGEKDVEETNGVGKKEEENEEKEENGAEKLEEKEEMNAPAAQEAQQPRRRVPPGGFSSVQLW